MIKKEKLFKLDSTETEIIITNNKTNDHKKLLITDITDLNFNEIFFWILNIISEFNDFENYTLDQIEMSDYTPVKDSNPPIHRELLESFKVLLENDLKSISNEIEKIKTTD